MKPAQLRLARIIVAARQALNTSRTSKNKTSKGHFVENRDKKLFKKIDPQKRSSILNVCFNTKRGKIISVTNLISKKNLKTRPKGQEPQYAVGEETTVCS